MPANQHLQWFDITDCSAGLWDEVGVNRQVIAPPNSFVQLDDYEPQPGGGLRAFYKGAAMVTTGITSPSTKIVTGIWCRGGVTNRTGGNDGDDLLLATIDSVSFKASIWRMDGSNNETTWKLVYQDAAGASNAGTEHTEFAMFRDSSNNVWYLWVLRGGSQTGLYKMAYVPGAGPPGGDGVTTYIHAFLGPMVVSQGRIIASTGGTLAYSDTGLTTWTSFVNQVLTPAANDPRGNIGMLSSIEPSDLLVGCKGAPWYEINGDISNVSTPVREMGDVHHQRVHVQHPARVPGGLAFIESGGRIFTTDGRNFQSLSDPIARFDLDIGSNTGPGQLVYQRDYLWAPKGKIYDWRTKAWFRSSLLTTSAFHTTNQAGKTYIANADIGVSLATNRIFEGGDATVTRCSSGVIQTAPYADKNGRNIDIREVQIFMQAYVASSFTVALIDQTGASVVSRTVSAVTGRQMVKFLFPQTKSEYLSVRITPSADDGTSEAPTIERMRIGFGINNLVN